MKSFKEFLEEQPTRKHFQMVADLIKSHPDAEKRKALAAHHTDIFAKQNPRFDKKRFYAASNVKEDADLLDVPTPSVNSIAEKHGVSVEQIEAQLKKGIVVEMEHTTCEDVAREIALDHLNETPDYYTKLEKVE